MKRLGIFSALFIFLALPVKAQDTIYCPSNKYYWNNETCNPLSAGIYSDPLHLPYYDTVIPRNLAKPIILKRIILPKENESTVYGIAGTPTACGNPNGCYYYLCKKIGTDYVIIDSAEWTHNSGEYNYVHYTLSPAVYRGYNLNEIQNPFLCYPTIGEHKLL